MNSSMYINSTIEMAIPQNWQTAKAPHNETDNLNSPIIIFKNKFKV